MKAVKMKIHQADSLLRITEYLSRPSFDKSDVAGIVKKIFDQVKSRGDIAVRELTLQFDKVEINDFQVSPQEIAEAEKLLDSSLKTAILQAKENIYTFHKAQMPNGISIETMPGVNCWTKWVAIDEIGIYIPGGTAPLFSTVLMLAVPAMIGACNRVALFTPPGQDGSVHPAILYAADICGVQEVYKIGGAQAIAAMTFGTEKVRRVNKIFGPGNSFVTEAKMQAIQQGVAIDLPAGPSEVMIIADNTADPVAVAADLLAQLEHGADSQAILLTNDSKFASAVNKEIQHLSLLLSRRNIIEKSIENSFSIVAKNDLIIEIANEYAPEHLIIQTNQNDYFMEHIRHAGSVFIGPWTPESAGDYASGTNHTLPTYGFARAWSGVNIFSYLKQITYQEISRAGLEALGPVIETMAKAEMLDAHAMSVSVRLNHMK